MGLDCNGTSVLVIPEQHNEVSEFSYPSFILPSHTEVGRKAWSARTALGADGEAEEATWTNCPSSVLTKPLFPSLLPRALPCLKEKRTMTKLQVSRVASPIPTVVGIENRTPAWRASALHRASLNCMKEEGKLLRRKVWRDLAETVSCF